MRICRSPKENGAIYVILLMISLCLFWAKQWTPDRVEDLLRKISKSGDNLTLHAKYKYVTTQCGRTYSDSLPFSSSISKGSCPALPHQSLAGGRRETTGNYPGIWHVDDCEFKWFLPHEACDIVGSVGKIYFHGDSLIRHLSIGLAVVLSGNYRSGGLPRATQYVWH